MGKVIAIILIIGLGALVLYESISMVLTIVRKRKEKKLKHDSEDNDEEHGERSEE